MRTFSATASKVNKPVMQSIWRPSLWSMGRRKALSAAFHVMKDAIQIKFFIIIISIISISSSSSSSSSSS